MAAPKGEDPVPIAIIGMACRFPGDATSPSKFWDLLKSGRDAYSPNSDRWNSDAFHHPKSGHLNTLVTKGGHFLKEDPYAFDAAFFNITAAEAAAFDPKQRITMEVAYEALENAGLPLQKVAGTQTACYIGSSMSDYRDMLARDFNNYPKYYILGNGEEMIANRLSHFLDIHGPSVTVQTACSSSLVAAHLACQSILTNESEMAIAGGVGLILTPDLTVQLNNLSALNPDGHSRSFDRDANGYARGEGAGVLVFKRLDKALRDGDPVRAVIRGSGVNSDGWTQGVTMPSGEAQEALIRRVYNTHKLDFSSVQYVEAHGTGTKAGDPIETGAISRTIGTGATKSRKLWVGSVKPNIGHLEAAAGVASIVKGVLAMENGMIPPNVHYSQPNPAIKLDEWNMAVPTRLTPWPVTKTKRMSINGFGIGGTNGHLILESLDPAEAQRLSGRLQLNDSSQLAVRDPPHNIKRLFVFSSHDQAGFKRISDALLQHLDTLGLKASSPDFLANLAHTLGTARSSLSWRSSCFAENVAQLRQQLSDAPGLGQNATRAPSSPPRIGYIFTGQGAQWAGMGVELLQTHPVFRDSVAQSAAFLSSMGCDWDPVTELQRPKDESRIKAPEISQPICTVLQIALVDLLQSWDVKPRKVVGHSSGEIAAAYCMGALTHRDAIAIAYFRGKVSAGLTKLNGGMMAVGCSFDEAQKLIKNHPELTGGKVTVACVNSPSSVTLSGDVEGLEKLRIFLDGEKVFARRLQVEVAYHSSFMQGAAMEYNALISDIEPRQPDIKTTRTVMISSVTGQECSSDMLGSFYWIRNLISPVLFSDALKELVSPQAAQDSNSSTVDVDLLIEIGPHSALGGPAEQILSHHGIENVGYKSILTRLQNAVNTSMQLASELFSQGVPLQFQRVNGDSECELLTNLPPYPWNHSKIFRCESRIAREHLHQRFPTRSLLGAPVPMMDETQHVWRHFLRLEDEPWLRGHKVGNTVLFPGAGMVSCVLEAAQQLVQPGKTAHAFRLRDVSLAAAMTLSEGSATEVIVHVRPYPPSMMGTTPASWWEFTMSSCVDGDQLRDNCRGLLAIDYVEDKSVQMNQEDAVIEASRIADFQRIVAECPATCTKEDFYRQISKAAWNYGDVFQGIEACHVGEGKGAYNVRIHDIGETWSKGQLERPFLLHAATLDAVFQGLLSSTWIGGQDGGFEYSKPYVPTHIGQLEVAASIPGEVGYVMKGFCTSEKYGFTDLSSNMTMFDDAVSQTLLVVKDFRVSEVNMDGESSSPEGASAGVDPTDITSTIRWNHALDVMEPEDTCRVVASYPVPQRMREFLKMLLHQKPGAMVIELLPNNEAAKDSVSAGLPEGYVPPSHIYFAVIDSKGESPIKGGDPFGQPFALGDSQSPLPDGIPGADILVIPETLIKVDNLGAILERATGLAKPGAMILVHTNEQNLRHTLEAKGLQQLSISEDVECPALYSIMNKTGLTNGVNGAPQQQAMIVEPEQSTENIQKFSESLQHSLREKGYSVTTSTLSNASQASENVVVVSLLELEKALLDDLSQQDFDLIKAVTLKHERLLWITCGEDPTAGVIDGLSRCIGSEMAGVRFQVLHLSQETGMQHGPALATRILSTEAAADDEYRERDGILQVARIHRNVAENECIRHHLEDAVRVSAMAPDEEDLRLSVGKPGLLDTLHFVEDDRLVVPLKEHELEIQVQATGINFRDIMASMGLIPMSVLGLEGSGIVTKAGAEASSRFKPGDRVSFLGVGTHTTKFRADYRVAALIPDSTSFEEAAALPVVYTTAYHALVNLGKLRRGQSVLIHAAAGGVGQSAIQIAKHLGLVVYATVGSQDKRQLLIDTYQIPEGHIFNSRDTSFAKGIMRVTDGRGVNCIINSLSGELLKTSWECVAPFGTFIEIGLRDILDNTRLDMRPFARSTTFTFLDLFGLYQEEPELLGTIVRDAFALIGQAGLRAPGPLTTYSAGQAGEAFRTMSQGKHRGKLVLSFSPSPSPSASPSASEESAHQDGRHRHLAPILRRAKDSLRLDAEGTYLLVGGLGGLGRSLARQLVACGARHLVFLSRSGPQSAEAQALTEELSSSSSSSSSSGTRVEAYAGDVADSASFRAAMDQCARDLPPIKGVVQMAMVLRDTVFEKMSYDWWRTGLRPKVQGTKNLHDYFDAGRPLDFFIICSSISGITGNPGQAQYDAGNTYQDSLAHYRRAHGLKATSVNLGIMRDVGVLAEQGATGNYKLWEETLGIRETAFHALFKSLIKRQTSNDPTYPAQLVTGLGTADIMATHGFEQPWYFQLPRFGPLAVTTSDTLTATSAGGRGQPGGEGALSLASQLKQAGSREQAVDIIREGLVGKVAEILQMPPSEVDPARPMYRYGVDSLVALEVRNWITREMKATVALLEVLAAVPIAAFAVNIAGKSKLLAFDTAGA